MAIRANKDTLAAIWILAQLKWSSRRIARLKLPTSHHTITVYYQTAYEMAKAKKLPIFAKDERAIRIRYCGDTKNLEKIDSVRNSGLCGGGRRVKQRIDDDYDGINEE